MLLEQLLQVAHEEVGGALGVDEDFLLDAIGLGGLPRGLMMLVPESDHASKISVLTTFVKPTVVVTDTPTATGFTMVPAPPHATCRIFSTLRKPQRPTVNT